MSFDTSAMIDADIKGLESQYPSLVVPREEIHTAAMEWVGGTTLVEWEHFGEEIEVEFTVEDAVSYMEELTAAIDRLREERAAEIRSWDEEELGWALEDARDDELRLAILSALSPSLAGGVTPSALLPLLAHPSAAVREAAIRLVPELSR